ncbi:MAG: hypothetical protein PHW52_03115 [Candidatus Pacebacteria bacterium]|nr:hypothetical protein [Candidatus Paceibacterota bacterium]
MIINDFLLKIKRIDFKKAIIYLLFGVLFISLFPLLNNHLFSGIDTCGHYYLAEKILEFMKSFHISGYDVNWFGGVPLFTFYNPLPYIVVSLFNILSFGLIPINFSFNVILFILPFLFLISVYYTANAFFNNSRISFFSLLFAFSLLFSLNIMNYGIGIFSQYNVGLFSNSFAWPILIFLIGFMEKMRRSKKKKYLFLFTLFLSALILSHIFTTIFSFVLFFIYFVINFKDKVFIKDFIMGIVSSLILTSFWWVPFLMNIQYSSGESINNFYNLIECLYSEPFIAPLLFVSSFLGIFSLFKDRNYFFPATFLLVGLFLASGSLDFLIKIPIHYYRFGAGMALINIFISAYGLNFLMERFKNNLILSSIIFWLFVISLCSGVLVFVGVRSYIDNEKNDDKKAEIVEFLGSNNQGRAIFDYDYAIENLSDKHYLSYALPKSGMQLFGGLLSESAIFNENYFRTFFSYYDFYEEFLGFEGIYKIDKLSIAGESENNLLYSSSEELNKFMIMKIKNLAFFRVKYIVFRNDITNPFLDFINSGSNQGMVSIAKQGSDYTIAQINIEMQPMISEMDYRPFLFIDEGGIFSKLKFKNFSENWYKNGYAIDYPIVYSPKNTIDLPESDLGGIGGYIVSSLKCPSEKDVSYWLKDGKPVVLIVANGTCYFDRDNVFILSKDEVGPSYKELYSIVSKHSEKADYSKIEPEIMNDEKLRFRSGSGTLINYSYFPKWKSINKEQEVYWATPSFIFVFGRGDNELDYGN